METKTGGPRGGEGSWAVEEGRVMLPDTMGLLLFFQVIYLKKTPEEAFRSLTSGTNAFYLPFR